MTIGSASQLSTMLAQMLYGQHHAASNGITGSNALSSPPGASQEGGMLSTIMQALQQVGVTGSQTGSGASSGSSSTPSSTQQSESQALQSFVQSLFAALQSQSGTTGASQGTAATTAAGLSGTSHGHGHRRGAHIQQGLQSLIQQLQSSSATSATSSTATTAANTSATSASSSSLTSLQQSFNNLVSAFGASTGNPATLGSFLNTLASDLGTKSTGNLLSVQA